jgi:hypothetical protein
MNGCVSLLELAANAGIAARKMGLILAESEAKGLVEQTAAGWWRLAPAAAEYVEVFRAIRPSDPVVIAPGELERLCDPGPTKAGLERASAT